MYFEVYGNILAFRRTIPLNTKKRKENEYKKRTIKEKQGKCVNKNVVYEIAKRGLSYLINAEKIARPPFFGHPYQPTNFFIISKLFSLINGGKVVKTASKMRLSSLFFLLFFTNLIIRI